jgi:hypothetical protein
MTANACSSRQTEPDMVIRPLQALVTLIFLRSPETPLHKNCGCRPILGVLLSITRQVPFSYLRLRKKLEASYSAILRKWAGNRNFCARDRRRDHRQRFRLLSRWAPTGFLMRRPSRCIRSRGHSGERTHTTYALRRLLSSVRAGDPAARRQHERDWLPHQGGGRAFR